MIYEAIDRWNDPNTYLEHHGVKGMKWGVRKKTYDVDVGIAKNKQTRKVAEDFHSLSDSQFKSRYQTSKKRFAIGIPGAVGDIGYKIKNRGTK